MYIYVYFVYCQLWQTYNMELATRCAEAPRAILYVHMPRAPALFSIASKWDTERRYIYVNVMIESDSDWGLYSYSILPIESLLGTVTVEARATRR